MDAPGGPLGAPGAHLGGRDVSEPLWDRQQQPGRDDVADSGGDGHPGESGDGSVPGERVVVVPGRVDDLRPLVGAHDDCVVALGHISDQARLDHDDSEPRTIADGREDLVDPALDRRGVEVLLAERLDRDRQVEAHQVEVCDGCVGDREVRDGQRVERSRVHADRHVRDGTVAWVHAQDGPDAQVEQVEQVEVVDESGRVLDVVDRALMRSERLRHRCTFVVVRDGEGRVLVHRRSPHKDMWPDRWDLAAGGVVQVGESWELAAARELAEELGVSGAELLALTEGDLVYTDDDVAELARVWTVTWDGPVVFPDGEVVEARWVSVDELLELLDAIEFVPDSVALALPLLVVPLEGR